MQDFWWADRFGWTPNQTDQLELHRANRLRWVAEAIDQGRAQAAKTETTSAEG